jgi:hypothetical protein
MHTRYVAYGLQLRCSFLLPGMTPQTGAGLPELTIELISPRELDDRWSGPDGPPQWRGTLGDGSSLTLQRGVEGDTLFTNGRRARYRLDAASHTLHCAPWEQGQSWQQTLLGRILPNVSIATGYEALHASAVESPAGVVAVAAPSGMGKTTLALELMRRGWPLVTDDVLTLSEATGGVRAHPGTPHMNVAPNQAGVLAEEIGTTLGMLAGEHWIAARATAEGARTVRMVCLLTRAPNLSLEARVLPAGPLPLSPYMLGLRADTERERRRFSLYAELASSATLLRLTSCTSDSRASLADRVEQTLADTAAETPLGSAR